MILNSCLEKLEIDTTCSIRDGSEKLYVLVLSIRSCKAKEFGNPPDKCKPTWNLLLMHLF